MDRNTRRIWTDEELLEILTRSDSEEEFADSSEDEFLDDEPQPEVAGPSSASGYVDVPSGNDGHLTSEDESEEEGGNLQEQTSLPILWSHKKAKPKIHPFDPQSSGNKSPLTQDAKEIDFFKLFFTTALVSHICQQVNNFNKYCIEQCSSEGDKERMKKFRVLEEDEFFVFTAITMLMTRVKKLAVKDYWTKDPMLSTPFFGQVMARDRYYAIHRFLHFNDNNLPNTGDRLLKIRSVVDSLRESFKQSFSPNRNICIDESLLLFKGNLFFKQYIPSKRSRFGIKTFVMCDCATGYVLDLIVYTGGDSDVMSTVKDIGKSGDIVSTLISPYLKKGHTLFVDNWYTSPTLFTWLDQMSTNACGTVKRNRKFMPQLGEKLKKGEFSFRTSGSLLALKWYDKREVWMLSTCHAMEMAEVTRRKTKEKVIKPTCIIDYNKNMGTVDRTDMMLSSVESVRKTVKWYKKLYFHMMDLAILNARSLHREVTKKSMPLAAFHKSLIHQLIEDHHVPRAKRGGGGRRSDEANPTRLRDRHFPSSIVSSGKKKGETKSVRCVF